MQLLKLPGMANNLRSQESTYSELLFTYGSLKPSNKNWAANYLHSRSKTLGKAYLMGRLTRVFEEGLFYPCLHLDGHQLIEGQLFATNKEVLDVIDIYEGPGYKKTRCVVRSAGFLREAVTYVGSMNL